MIVFDTSAFMVITQLEKGHDKVLPYLGQAVMSSVNWAEAVHVMVRKNKVRDFEQLKIDEMLAAIIPFDKEQAEEAGRMAVQTKPYGLSLGDRACLALGKKLKLPVITTDHIWAKLDVGVEVRVVG